MTQATLLAQSDRLLLLTQVLSIHFLSHLIVLRCSKKLLQTTLFRYETITYKNFAVLSVLSDPVVLCSLVILCPPPAGTGCNASAPFPKKTSATVHKACKRNHKLPLHEKKTAPRRYEPSCQPQLQTPQKTSPASSHPRSSLVPFWQWVSSASSIVKMHLINVPNRALVRVVLTTKENACDRYRRGPCGRP